MRRAPFSTVHFTFTVRVLEPLRLQAMRRRIPLQTLLRRAMRQVAEQRATPALPSLPEHVLIQGAMEFVNRESRLARQAFSSLESEPRS